MTEPTNTSIEAEQAHIQQKPIAPALAKTKGANPAIRAVKAKRYTKASKVEALLTRKSGATLDQISKVTSWQPHTCRAFLSGLRKNGREVVRETGKSGKSIYWLGETDAAVKAS